MNNYPKYDINVSDDNTTIALSTGDITWTFVTEHQSSALHIHKMEGHVEDETQLLALLDILFSKLKVTSISIDKNLAKDFSFSAVYWQQSEDGLKIQRSAFYQIRELWLDPALLPIQPAVPSGETCEQGEVPVRPRWHDRHLYRRYIPTLNKTLEIRRATVEEDGERFHRWQNDPRVSEFWEYPWEKPKLDQYIEEHRADPHCEPLIVSLDGEAFAYVESYWCKEDRLGSYYETQDFDQGFHLLIGEPQYQGVTTPHFLRAVTHFLFLVDPRTQNVMGEPRVDNKNIFKLIPTVPGWKHYGVIEFPHKTANLLGAVRGEFFTGNEF